MKLLLLGSTGYLGHNILARLLKEKNLDLTVPVRNPEKLQKFFAKDELKNVDIVSCDLTLIEYLLMLMKRLVLFWPCSYPFHSSFPWSGGIMLS